MNRGFRAAAMGAAALLGTGAAFAAAAGSDNVKACVVKKTGEIQAATSKGRCGRAEFAITIAGDAFKRSSRGGTLTINGVAFKRSGSRGITINGTSFRSSGPVLTINGTSFRSSGHVLTINGTTFEPGSAARPGPMGPQGPQGPPGTLSGPPPREVGGPVAVKVGAGRLVLASESFSAGAVRRVLVTGGFDAVCNPCNDPVDASWTLELDGTPVVTRRIGTLSGEEGTGVHVSEIVVTKGACSPCQLRIAAGATAGRAGEGSQIDATGIRLGLVDAGEVGG